MNDQSDTDLMVNALQMWANYVETRDVNLSANDAHQMRKTVRPLGEDGMELVLRLRKLARTLAETAAASPQTKMAAAQPYGELSNTLSHLPMTWYPALLSAMVEGAYAKNVFKKGQIHIYVKGIEDKCQSNLKTCQGTPVTAHLSPMNPLRRRPKESS